MRSLLNGCRTDEDMIRPSIAVKEPCNIGRMPSLPHGAWRFMPKGAVCLLTLFLTFLPFLGSATAADGFEVNGTVLIQPGYYSKLPFAMANDGVFEFDIEVRSGPNIDVILIPYSELGDYQNGNSFMYYPGGTFSDCDEADGDVYLDSGTYCLILSNDGGTAASVYYSYTPTALQGDSDNQSNSVFFSSTMMIVLIGMISLIAIMAITGILILKVKVQKGRPLDASFDDKFCKNCGELVPSDSSYCEKCGSRAK